MSPVVCSVHSLPVSLLLATFSHMRKLLEFLSANMPPRNISLLHISPLPYLPSNKRNGRCPYDYFHVGYSRFKAPKSFDTGIELTAKTLESTCSLDGFGTVIRRSPGHFFAVEAVDLAIKRPCRAGLISALYYIGSLSLNSIMQFTHQQHPIPIHTIPPPRLIYNTQYTIYKVDNPHDPIYSTSLALDLCRSAQVISSQIAHHLHIIYDAITTTYI